MTTMNSFCQLVDISGFTFEIASESIRVIGDPNILDWQFSAALAQAREMHKQLCKKPVEKACVYLLQMSSEVYKIGVTKNIDSRMYETGASAVLNQIWFDDRKQAHRFERALLLFFRHQSRRSCMVDEYFYLSNDQVEKLSAARCGDDLRALMGIDNETVDPARYITKKTNYAGTISPIRPEFVYTREEILSWQLTSSASTTETE